MSLTPELTKIHEFALHAASSFKEAEVRLLEALSEVEKSSVHFKLGYSSLFQYAVSSLGLSEAVAYNAIAVARKAREVPELKSVGISKARKIVSVLTAENQKDWIEKARTLSSRALEKAVAKENPRASTPEQAKYVSEKRLDLRLGLTEELMLKLRRAQDQVSQDLNKAATLEETLEQVLALYLKHKDPLEKARRVIAKNGNKSLNKLFTGTVQNDAASEPPVARIPIPKGTEHLVRLRDKNQCQAQTPRGICGQRRFIDLHHLKPVSQGGTNAPENLLTLCRTHHRQIHRGSSD